MIKMKFRWASIKPISSTIEEINALNEKYKKYPIKKTGFGCAKVKAIRTRQFIDAEDRIELRICHGYNQYERYICKKVFDCDELKDTSGITGKDAYDYVNELFQNEHKTNITLYRAFSGTKYKDQYKAIKHCVPKQIAYILNYTKGRIVDKAYKADVSSAFPSQMKKDLPTLHDCQVISGRSNPSEEYPFAFYTKSGHIKIYNELDTRNMKNRYYSFYDEVYDDSIKAEDEITILCKKSEYKLDKEFDYMYSQRKVDINQKMYMNACIGYFHRNGDPRLSLLAAVVIARNNNEMLDRINQLVSEGNTILYVATDSIVWRGKYSNLATKDKYLGSFTYEGENGKFFGRMIGAYQYLDDKNNLTIKCSYLKNDTNKENIPFGKLPEPKHETKFIVSRSGNDIKIINVFGE